MRPQNRKPRTARAGRGFAAVLLAVPALFGFGWANRQPEPQQPAATPTQPTPSPDPQPTVDPGAGTKEASQPAVTKPRVFPDVEILLTDGRRLNGQLVDRTDEVLVVRIAGIETRLRVADVAEIKPMRPVEERHRDMRAGIDDTDETRLLRLAEWAQSKGRPDLALEDVQQVLAVNPRNPEALELKTLLEAQMALPGQHPDQTPGGSPKPERPKFPMLDEDQINLIRVYEVDLSDPPRMLIAKDSVRKFIETYAGQGPVPASKDGREAFARKPAAKILEAMFDLQAREFYSQVRVEENPPTMRAFREDVHRWVIASCATNECHGGAEAGRFQLNNKRPNSDASVYTNFYIIDRFRTAEGLALLDFENPARSPLLQYALPQTDAMYKHPELNREGRNQLKPAFRSENDDKFEATVGWIKSLYLPRPEYPITYTPPAPLVAPSVKPSNPKPR